MLSILGKRMTEFLKLLAMLRALEKNRECLSLLSDLNRTLVQAIIGSERDLIKSKAKARAQLVALKTRRPSKERAATLRWRIEALNERTNQIGNQLWLWRLFGDSVAHIYLDKFAIKHTFFETDTYDVKPDAGMMDGKTGLAQEIGLLLEALKHNVPAILCDCTNVLRYGDVCLLGENDPYLIEVKSSTRLNQRGKRQAAKLERLQNFLKTDVATGFRGNPGEVRRMTIETPETVHTDVLNNCLEEARKSGCVIVSPEPGLNYVVIYDSSHNIDFSKMDMSEGLTIYGSWNDAKNVPDWAYYVPFLLTIRNSDHIIDFIEGKVVIMVYVNTETLVRHCSAEGWKAIFLEEGDYSVACQHVESGGVMGLSRQMLFRVVYDCTSLRWMGRSQLAAMARAWSEREARYGPNMTGDQRAYVEGNLGIRYDDLMARFADAREGPFPD